MSQCGNNSRRATAENSAHELNREGIKYTNRQVRKPVRWVINNLIYALEGVEKIHRYAIEEQGKAHHKNVRRVCEDTCDLAPSEHLIVFAIRVRVTTLIIGKVSAIGLALFLGEKSDTSG